MEMFSKFKKQIISFVCILVIGLPNILSASPFSTDSSLEVFPYNETLNFETSTNKEVSQSFSIKNTSNNDKTVYVNRYPSNGFQYLGASYVKIPAQSSSYITINFSSSKSGNYQSELKLQHNDTRETKTIKLNATVYGSNTNNGLYISDTTINFGKKVPNSRATSSLTITNNNSYEVNFSHSQVKAPFRVLSYPTKLKPNESGVLTVEFEPTSKGSFSNNLVLNTSDPRKSTINLTLKGASDEHSNTDNKVGELKLNGTFLQFNQVPTGMSISQKIIIQNPNNFDVKVKLPSDIKKPFQANLQNAVKGNATIKAKSSKTLSVIFEPTQKKFYEQSIKISTNLSNNPVYTINVQGNAIYRNETPTPTPNNPYSNNPYQPPAVNSYTSLKVTKNNINPDLSEIAYFNFNLGNEFESKNLAALVIKDPRLNQNIYHQSQANLPKGRNDWKIKWNGKNFQGNSVLEGNYEYELHLISISGYKKVYQGTINVVRNPAHIPHKITHTPNQIKNCLQYTDVKFDTNLCDAIVFADSQELLKDKENRFYPNQKVTRAQALSSIVKLFDLEMETYDPKTDKNLGFSDLNSTDWFMPFLKTVQVNDKNNQILSGYSSNEKTEFKPEQIITRAEAYKLFFEVANLETQKQNNYLMDYYLTEKPFKDTLINSNYDWYTPYAGMAQRNFNGSNFARKYYGNFQINNQHTKFCGHTEIDKEEFFELIYEAHKTKTIQFK
jgi:hypothetical protein